MTTIKTLEQKVDDIQRQVYLILGGISALGLLHFIDPIWHWGLLQFP